ncbi:hypothetical protein NDU88_005286 [Pleurodeles waltl]|uniref:Uncharacterized protein n=1 Tax=Pleurodeles waltl TaxID=8319 RepID=A0AAV7SLC3_PLEWA|nr:hypothetical protein NDU88_005286 [Pleurodeles waltl]
MNECATRLTLNVKHPPRTGHGADRDYEGNASLTPAAACSVGRTHRWNCPAGNLLQKCLVETSRQHRLKLQ